VTSNVLSLVGGLADAHPAPYVNTAVAYPVGGPRDSSMMGGGNFADLGDGTFATGDLGTADGYSAHELYLMGLMAPEEVQPWFYLADTNPPLGQIPWAPEEIIVSGKRKEVRMQQIVDAIGPRLPAYDGTQKTFRVVYVILERPGAPVTESEVRTVSGYIAAFERRFAVATGGRGAIAPPVARGALDADFGTSLGFSGVAIVARRPMWFIDVSRGNVTGWKWTFGDGQTATWQHPKHTFRAPGTYTVTLEISDGIATSAASHTVTVAPNLKRRAVAP
jgi:hypothetical protein